MRRLGLLFGATAELRDKIGLLDRTSHHLAHLLQIHHIFLLSQVNACLLVLLILHEFDQIHRRLL